MIACTPKGYYRIEMNKKLTDNLADLKIMRKKSYYYECSQIGKHQSALAPALLFDKLDLT